MSQNVCNFCGEYHGQFSKCRLAQPSECKHQNLMRHDLGGQTWWQCEEGCDFLFRAAALAEKPEQRAEISDKDGWVYDPDAKLAEIRAGMAAPPVPQAEPQPITSPEVFSLVQTILAHHQQAYAKFHNAEGHKVIESHNMAIGAASVPLEQWINQRDATIRREAERGMDDLRRDLKFEQDCYANLKGEVVATLQYICDHPPSAEWLKGLNEVREALRALADSPVSGQKK